MLYLLCHYLTITSSVFSAPNSVQSLLFRCHTFRVKLSMFKTSQEQACFSAGTVMYRSMFLNILVWSEDPSPSTVTSVRGKKGTYRQTVSLLLKAVLKLTGQAHLTVNVFEPVVYLKWKKQKRWDKLVSTSERQVSLLLSIRMAHNSVAMEED